MVEIYVTQPQDPDIVRFGERRTQSHQRMRDQSVGRLEPELEVSGGEAAPYLEQCYAVRCAERARLTTSAVEVKLCRALGIGTRSEGGSADEKIELIRRPGEDRDPHLRRNETRGFFFQAEDGIRDYKVTGVQTCALP